VRLCRSAALGLASAAQPFGILLCREAEAGAEMELVQLVKSLCALCAAARAGGGAAANRRFMTAAPP
jgi:hypothetical protein